MRLSLVSVVCVAFVASMSPVEAHGQRQLELSVLGGTAHTDRTARLSAEQWIEPYSGLRVDARLRTLWGGRAGVALQLDRYGVQRAARISPPCFGICSAIARAGGGLVDYRSQSADSRLLLGASWQRPIVSWLRADLLGLVGVRRLESDIRWGELTAGEPSTRRSVVGAEAGLSTQWRAVVAGAAFQYSSGDQWSGVRRGQNRVSLRLGYALPLGAE